MKLRRLSTRGASFDAELAALTRYDAAQDSEVEAVVKAILRDVRARGEDAVLEYARRFDKVSARSLAELEVPPEKTRSALASLSGERREALQAAHERIRSFHERQLQKSWDYTEPDGTRLGQRVMPLERVGLYVPGGKAAYPSSVLMNAVPAKVAGVASLVMVSPNP